MRKNVITLVAVLLTSLVSIAEIVQLRTSIVDTNALTFAMGDKTRFSTHVNGRTHQQTPIVSRRGYQYTIYYNDARHVCVGRRKLQSEKWDVIEFDDYVFQSSDSHNTAVIGVCDGDGTIHLAFDHHVSSLHYRVSVLGAADRPEEVEWDKNLFGPVTDQLGSVGRVDKLTYPRFFNAPNGNLMLSYRYVTSGNGDSMLQEYDGEIHDWTVGLGRFVARDIGEYERDDKISNYRCAYMNNLTYSGNRLHASWVWRDRFEKTSVANQHDLSYAYSDDDGRIWRNNKGSVIGKTGTSKVIHLDSSGLVVAPIEMELKPANQNGHYAYPDGSIHIMLLQYPAKGAPRTFCHYWRDVKGRWNNKVLSFSGGRPKIVGDRDGTLFMFYESGNSLNIAKGTPNARRTDWNWKPIYKEDRVIIGSEAVIDFTRWEQERVISAYMQEKPDELLRYGSGEMIDGKPSALMVIDYQVSVFAANPEPSSDALNVPVNTSLSWEAGVRAKAHQLYIGIDAVRVAKAKKTSREFIGQIEDAEYHFPKNLKNGSDFFWRVDEVHDNNVVKRGQVWTFSTIGAAP